jgi:ferredoxin-NADP reductase
MTTNLADRQEIAERTMAFHFEKPPGWTFEAGQAIDITVLALSETDVEGNTRTFTIASAPYEKSVMALAHRARGTSGTTGHTSGVLRSRDAREQQRQQW